MGLGTSTVLASSTGSIGLHPTGLETKHKTRRILSTPRIPSIRVPTAGLFRGSSATESAPRVSDSAYAVLSGAVDTDLGELNRGRVPGINIWLSDRFGRKCTF